MAHSCNFTTRPLLLAAGLLWLVGALGCRPQATIVVAAEDDAPFQTGMPLLHNGIAIGRISALTLRGHTVFAEVELLHQTRIAPGSKFRLAGSLLGSKSLLLDASARAGSLAATDTVWLDTTTPTITAQDSVRQRQAQKALQKIAEGLHELLAPDLVGG